MRVVKMKKYLLITIVLHLVVPCLSMEIDTTKFKGLKAVLVVGHVEDSTPSFIKEVEKVAGFFESKGVKVYKFYDKEANWEKIIEASKGAHFFLYNGHGRSPQDNGYGGGFCITSNITSNQIVEKLELDENAIVLFKSVCYGAGSAASDDKDIGLKEAIRRVSNYSKPLFKTGAKAYFANNLGDGIIKFLHSFFKGVPAIECFNNIVGGFSKKESLETYKYDASKKIGIASTDWGGIVTKTTYRNGVKTVTKVPATKDYDIAIVATESFSIQQMLK
jgi:hypothetical protein